MCTFVISKISLLLYNPVVTLNMENPSTPVKYGFGLEKKPFYTLNIIVDWEFHVKLRYDDFPISDFYDKIFDDMKEKLGGFKYI